MTTELIYSLLKAAQILCGGQVFNAVTFICYDSSSKSALSIFLECQLWVGRHL